jgi:hypothetical protein
MRKMNRFVLKLAIGMIAVAAMMSANHLFAESVSQVVTVIKVDGHAQYSTDNSKTWQTLKKGDVLKPGAVVRTANKSAVDIMLGERTSSNFLIPASTKSTSASSSLTMPDEEKANVVRIFQSTVLGIDKLTLDRTGIDEVSETQLDLRAGQIMGNVKKLSAASKYEVKIPNGVAGIRGTVYLVSSSGVVSVLKGSVVIAVVGADGSVSTRVVTAKNSYDPTTGLISPIPGNLFGELVSLYNTLHGPGETPPTSYPHDHTIIYVSPVDSGNGQGQNGNGQGQNGGH